MKPVGYALRTFLRPDLLQMVRNAYEAVKVFVF
jgi:hypothetical protein